ncbi:MAG: HesA/MoeB/ThiF family protein [Bacteroidales bacterium]|nr:HesA/MoeB/ThiF family protein [Bacteroidales bacterium]
MTVLSKNDILRYHRQLIIPAVGEEGQEKLMNARVLVVGAGGLGSPVLLYLAAAGVGTLGVVDPDDVHLSNLQRQVLYVTGDITRLKVEAAAERLSRLNPLVEVMQYPVRFDEANAMELLRDYEVAVDCSDNYATRYLLNDSTRAAGIPMIYGAVSQFMGQVSVFNYMGGPSYRDLYPEETRTEADASPSELGVIGALPGIIGSCQACEAIKIITGAGEILSGRLLQVDALNLRYEIITL